MTRKADLLNAPDFAGMTEERSLLNTREAARFLGVTAWCMEYWRSRTRADGPDFVKMGRLVRYRLGDLERYVRRRTVRRGSSAKVHQEDKSCRQVQR